MHLKEGTLLKGGTYRIIRFIASGGFGCTYEAVHLMLNKRVAIKEFFPKTFCNRDSDTSHVTVGTQSQHGLVNKLKVKFVNEAQSIAQLTHPGIIKVTDVFEDNGTAYYVMDYIEGKSLGSIVDEKRKLTEAEALSYIHQICDALEYVHDQNRLHLDIKPGNIMIDRKGRAILIDFGASKQYDEENGENTSTLIGKTPGFAPIEQMGNDVSHFRPATDIYSLGATFYKCLSGKVPLEPNLLVQGDELDPLPSDISESTKKAIEAAMELNPKKRPQTIKDFLSILDQSNSGNQESEGTIYEGAGKNVPIADNTGKSVNKSASPEISTHSNLIKGTSNTANSEHSSNSNNFAKENKSKSSKTNIIIGVAAAVIIALLCWIAFGKNNQGLSSQNEELEGIALVSDTLINPSTEESSQDKVVEPVSALDKAKSVTFEIIPPTNVKVGDEFKVTYRLSNDKGTDFKVKDITGCLKVSGPIVSETKNGLEYTFTYKAEKEGSFTIPSATLKLDGKIINSDNSKFYIQSTDNKVAQDISVTQTEPSKENVIPSEPTPAEPPKQLSSESEPIKTPIDNTKGSINGHEWVDLGLPSGLKWATCNIGASKPERVGNFYSWGDTKPGPSDDNCDTYKKKYKWLRNNNYIDWKGNLTSSHDAAHLSWGGTWRMPTLNEFQELINNTTSEWETRGFQTGYLFKSKKNGNSIFLPAGGIKTRLSLTEVGGFYWSSTPSEKESEFSGLLQFITNRNCEVFYKVRKLGFCIRPVAD